MKLFAVRHIRNKEAVGFFWVRETANLIEWVDQVTEPVDCEIQEIEIEGGFGWESPAPAIGIVRDEPTASADYRSLIQGMSPFGAAEPFFLDDIEDGDWHPLSLLMSDIPWARIKDRAKPARVVPPAAPALRRTSTPDPEPTNTVYFIECDGHIKIGTTSGPVRKRLKALSTGHHSELILLATIANVPGQLEFDLHRQFAEFRVRGEWFLKVQPLLDYIRDNAKEPEK